VVRVLRAVTALSVVPRTFSPPRDVFLQVTISWPRGSACSAWLDLVQPGISTGVGQLEVQTRLTWNCGVDTIFVSNKYREIRWGPAGTRSTAAGSSYQCDHQQRCKCIAGEVLSTWLCQCRAILGLPTPCCERDGLTRSSGGQV
jgi:hypothetical protein